jgi:flagellar hook-basal body complex protein FliE
MQPAAIAASVGTTLTPGLSAGPAVKAGAPFGDLLRQAVGGIDGLEQQASNAVDGLMRGTGVEVHDAIIATEKADMSFELALAVRNKAVAAYQQVMSMQF